MIARHGLTAAPEARCAARAARASTWPPTAAGYPTRQPGAPDPKTDTTHVILFAPRAGTCTVVREQGEASTSIQVADGLPPVHVTARVSGSGPHRVLRWSTRPVAGQSVTYVERGAGVAHTLLRTRDRTDTYASRPPPLAGGPADRSAGHRERLPRDQLAVTRIVASPHPTKGNQQAAPHRHAAALVPPSRRSRILTHAATSNGATSSFLTHHASVRVPGSMRHQTPDRLDQRAQHTGRTGTATNHNAAPERPLTRAANRPQPHATTITHPPSSTGEDDSWMISPEPIAPSNPPNLDIHRR